MLGGLYVDMDGVMVDFMLGVKQQTGVDWNSPVNSREEKRARGVRVFEAGPGFWVNLPPMPDFTELWKFIQPHDPCILTAVPRGFHGEPPSQTSIQYAKDGKWIWNTMYTGVDSNKFHAVLREEKQLYATKEVDGHILSNVLIDDHEPNIKEWTQNRGIGILHTSAKDTIQKLRGLGYC